MAVRLDPWQNIVGLGFPALAGKEAFLLVRIHHGTFNPDAEFQSTNLADQDDGLSYYSTPSTGYALRQVDSSASDLTRLKEVDAYWNYSWRTEYGFDPGRQRQDPDGLDYSAQTGRFYRIKDPETSSFSLLNVLSSRPIVFGRSLSPSTASFPTPEDTYLYYGVEFEFWWGDNLDPGQIDSYGNYTGPYEKTDYFFQNYTETYKAHSYLEWSDTWYLKRSFSVDMAAGTIAGPGFEY